MKTKDYLIIREGQYKNTLIFILLYFPLGLILCLILEVILLFSLVDTGEDEGILLFLTCMASFIPILMTFYQVVMMCGKYSIHQDGIMIRYRFHKELLFTFSDLNYPRIEYLFVGRQRFPFIVLDAKPCSSIIERNHGIWYYFLRYKNHIILTYDKHVWNTLITLFAHNTEDV